MIRTRSFVLAGFLALAACSRPAADIAASDAWVRLPPVADRPGAAYFTLRNPGAATTLTGIESAKVKRIELHESMAHDGMMHMKAMPQVPIGAGATIAFEPGGKHAMLFGIDGGVKAGATLPLTLVFEDGRRVAAEAKVVGLGDAAPGAE